MYFPEHQVAFVAINRTASSSLLTALTEGLYSADVPAIWQFKAGHRLRRERDILKHAQAYFYYAQLGQKRYGDAYVFTQVRNPWDKMVSDFLFRCRAPRDVSKWRNTRQWFVAQGIEGPTTEPSKALFKEFILAFNDKTQRAHRQWTRISKEYDLPDVGKDNVNQMDGLSDLAGNIMVDKVMRFESIQEDWDEVRAVIANRTGVHLRELPHLNKANRLDYRAYYDDESRETVARVFSKDIDAFGYSF
ncbi:MAG: sulfotransferase family 2 domain-containing protein [Halioglobus sp.]